MVDVPAAITTQCIRTVLLHRVCMQWGAWEMHDLMK
jgi:hypothetical protein